METRLSRAVKAPLLATVSVRIPTTVPESIAVCRLSVNQNAPILLNKLIFQFIGDDNIDTRLGCFVVKQLNKKPFNTLGQAFTACKPVATGSEPSQGRQP